MKRLKPAELMKAGIQSGDWKKVADGYNRMFGGRLKPPKAGPARASAKAVAQAREEALSGVRPLAARLVEVLQGERRGNVVDLAMRLADTVGAAPAEPATPAAGKKRRPKAGADEEESRRRAGHDPPGLSERARAARAFARGEAQDFTHVHAGTPARAEHESLGTLCRREPFPVGRHKNTFRDDGRAFQAERKFDRRVTRGMGPSERRPPPPKVKVRCDCGWSGKVDPILAPRNLGEAKRGESDVSSFRCDDCIRRARVKS